MFFTPRLLEADVVSETSEFYTKQFPKMKPIKVVAFIRGIHQGIESQHVKDNLSDWEYQVEHSNRRCDKKSFPLVMVTLSNAKKNKTIHFVNEILEIDVKVLSL